MGVFLRLQRMRYMIWILIKFECIIFSFKRVFIARYGFQTYNPKLSSTFVDSVTDFSINYGDGSSYSGTIFYDKLSISGASIKSQQMAQITTVYYSQGNTVTIILNNNINLMCILFILNSNISKGIFGMGLKALSNSIPETVPFYTALYNSGAISRNAFSFWFNT